MKSLPIVWQRLIDSNGQTCDRCGSTYEGIKEAVEKLEVSLKPLGIEPTVEIREIDKTTFTKDPTQSNRIWIAGKPLEKWLLANVSSSPCCSVCGDSECRTIELENQVFETIPMELILRAALIAAAKMAESGIPSSSEAQDSECCSD